MKNFLSMMNRLHRTFNERDEMIVKNMDGCTLPFEKDEQARVMDWRNEDYDRSSIDSFTWEDRNPLAKSRSDASITAIRGYNLCSQGIQVALGGCRESKSVTSAIENLNLGGDGSQDELSLSPRTRDNQTSPYTDNYDQVLQRGIATREITSLRVIIQPSEILRFQGVLYSPEDVAPYWKKDSRMWLWKSVRLAQKRNRMKNASAAKPSDLEEVT